MMTTQKHKPHNSLIPGARFFAPVLFAAAAVVAPAADDINAVNAINDFIPPQSDALNWHLPVADGGYNFADFYKQQQARLFAHIDDALAAQTEKTITDNFAAVQKAEVNLQTKLGGRKGNIGINIIGAFAKTHNHAFGWQLRAYTGQKSSTGANAGMFYRIIDDGLFYGANAIADYENHDHGGFLRYSIGGELKHPLFSFAANYYIPITDDKRINATVAAFSREGYDAQLRVNINAPDFYIIKAAVDYYNFDGNGDTKKEDGLRYGLELQPYPALRFGLFYDDGGEKIGGDIAYSHTIGEAQTGHNNGEAFAPDLFAPVSREYSQRIATAIVSASPVIVFNTTVTLMTTSVLTFTTMTLSVTNTVFNTTEMMEIVREEISLSVMASRVASVRFTMRAADNAGSYLILTSRHGTRVTLPPADTSRPWVLTITRNLAAEVQALPASMRPVIFDTNIPNFLGPFNFHVPVVQGVRTWTLTVMEGSENYAEPTTTTLTNTTTTTIDAMTTTMTVTLPTMTTTMTTTAASIVVSTTITLGTITLGANAAINPDDGGISPFIPPPPKLPQLPQMALADMPILHRQTRQTSPSSSFPHSIYRHSRAAGAGISLRPKGAPIMPHKRHH